MNDLSTKVLGSLILAGILGIFTQIHYLEKDVGSVRSDLKGDISEVRQELIQYHTIVGFLQKEIEELNEEMRNGRSGR